MQDTPDLLAHRLNFDAIVFAGCTMKEMQAIAFISLTFCVLVLGFFTKLMLNMFLVGVGLAFPIAVGMSWGMALVFQKIKQGKPKGYVKQQILIWCADHQLMPLIYIRRTGKWSVGRHFT